MRRSPLALLDPHGDTSSPVATDRDRDACRATFAQSLLAAPVRETPYRHWLMQGVLPADMARSLNALPFPAPPLDGVSGSREIHNNTRRYIDAAAIAQHAVCRSLAEAFQDPATVAMIEEVTGARLDGCCLQDRIRPGHRRFLAAAAHRSRGQEIHPALLPRSGRPAGPGNRHLSGRRDLVASRPVREWRRTGLRAFGPHLARVRAPADPGGAQVADHQLRHRGVDGPRAAGLSGHPGQRPPRRLTAARPAPHSGAPGVGLRPPPAG